MRNHDTKNQQRLIRVGLIDSGVAEHIPVVASCGFSLDKGDGCSEGVAEQLAQPDKHGHGTAVADIIQTLAPESELLSAQVLSTSGMTSALQVAAAIYWLLEQEVDVINLSLGWRHRSELLAQACAFALASGTLLVASTPAQGEPVYPAAFSGVIRATGDARCDHHQWVWLNNAQADLGACVQPITAAGRGAGASMGCAHISAFVAAELANNPHWRALSLAERKTRVLQRLQQQASAHGREFKIPQMAKPKEMHYELP